MTNDVFHGDLDLNGNDLTDLAALHLAKIFDKTTGHNITKINLSGNKFTSKAGEYFGQALSNNPSYPIKKIQFTGISLESIGLTRIIEAVNCNEHIKRLDIGILSDQGLKDMAEMLRPNEHLDEITFQETSDPQKLWTSLGRGAFSEMMKDCTKLKRVNISFKRENHEAD